MAQGAQIGKVAKATGLSIDTIRFYAKRGLLKDPPRTEGGFRLFSPADVRELKFIRRSQQLGFSLDEIRDLLVLRVDDKRSCVNVRDRLRQKLRDVRENVEQLKILEKELHRVLRNCDRELQTSRGPHGGCCPVLEEIRAQEARKK
jgi:DNA-binding transcriptional MerR regulator